MSRKTVVKVELSQREVAKIDGLIEKLRPELFGVRLTRSQLISDIVHAHKWRANKRTITEVMRKYVSHSVALRWIYETAKSMDDADIFVREQTEKLLAILEKGPPRTITKNCK